MTRPIKMKRPGVTKFQQLAEAARRKAAFEKLVATRGKTKNVGRSTFNVQRTEQATTPGG